MKFKESFLSVLARKMNLACHGIYRPFLDGLVASHVMKFQNMYNVAMLYLFVTMLAMLYLVLEPCITCCPFFCNHACMLSLVLEPCITCYLSLVPCLHGDFCWNLVTIYDLFVTYEYLCT